jgi:glycosyltransferase involved in cell wall biosynthesis
VAIVHSEYSSRVPSGENNVVLDQEQALKNAGLEVVLIAERTPTDKPNFISSMKIACRVAFGFGNSPLKELKQFNPDIVLINNLFPNYSSSWLKKIKAKKIFVIHNYRFLCANGMFFIDNKACFKCVERSVFHAIINRCYRKSLLATIPVVLSQLRRRFFNNELRHVDSILTLSAGSKKLLVQFGFPNSKVQLIPNFLNSSLEKIFLNDSSNKVRAGWVACGRLSEEKGFLELVRNWPENYALDIIGDGPQLDLIQEFASKKSNVRILGRKTRTETIEALMNYNGAIFPSMWPEVAPITAIEFLRAGLPIISLNCNVVGGFVDEQKAGLSIDEFTPTNLSGALEQIEDQISTFRSAALLAFETNFSEKVWVDRMSIVFEDLLRIK